MTMWFGVISIMTEMIAAATRSGVFGRAIEQNIVSLDLFDPRAHTSDRHQTVDDRPYGGGPGMVMMVAPLLAAIAEAKAAAAKRGVEAPLIYLSPQGEQLNQEMVKEFAGIPGLILLSGRYEGIDERVVDQVDQMVSIGDYVLSGGELPAMVMMDAI